MVVFKSKPFFFHLSFLFLLLMFWLLKKVCHPTRWTSLIPFPTLLHLPSLSFLSLLLLQEHQIPIQTPYHKCFFLLDSHLCPASLPPGMEIASQPPGWQPCVCLTATFGQWGLGCCCFLSVLLQWRKVLNYWYFLSCTLPILSCQKSKLPFLVQEGGSGLRTYFTIKLVKKVSRNVKIICVLEICGFARAVVSR